MVLDVQELDAVVFSAHFSHVERQGSNLVCRKLVKKYRKFSATKNVIPSESAVLMDLDPNALKHEHKKGMAV